MVVKISVKKVLLYSNGTKTPDMYCKMLSYGITLQKRLFNDLNFCTYYLNL